MASAFTKLFLPSHRKRNSISSAKRPETQPASLQPPQHPPPSGRKSFASVRPSFQASIQEDEPSQFGLPSRHHAGFLTTDSLNAPHIPPADDLTARRDSFGFDPDCRPSVLPLRDSDPAAQLSDCDAVQAPSIAAASAFDNACRPPEDDDDDLDDNPIFLRLSEDVRLQPDWDAARLVLVPLCRCLLMAELSEQACLEDDTYIALHAFAPSRLFRDQFASVRSTLTDRHSSKAETSSASQDPAQSTSEASELGAQRGSWDQLAITATLLPDQRAVNVSISRSASASSKAHGYGPLQTPRSEERKLRIVAETTVYRTVPVAPDPQAPMISPVRPSASSGFEVVSRANPAKPPPKQEKVKVRVISVDEVLVPPSMAPSHSDGGSALATPSSAAGGSGTQHLQPGSVASRNAGSADDDAPIDIAGDLTISSVAAGTLSDAVLSAIPVTRSFAMDLRLLLSPPTELTTLAAPFAAAFDALSSAALEFCFAFVFVKGFEQYNVNRIRRGIFQKAWRVLLETLAAERGRGSQGAASTRPSELSSDASQRLQEVLENVVLGYVHDKVYGSAADQLAEVDQSLEELLALYESCGVSLVELGVYVPTLRHRPGRLEGAVMTLRNGLLAHRPEELDDALASADRTGLLQVLDAGCPRDDPDSASGSDSGLDLACTMAASLDLAAHPPRAIKGSGYPPINVRTPRETMQALKATIDEVGLAVQRSHLASSRTSLAATLEQAPLLSTDDLLPVLAYVVIKAQPAKLASCLHYAKTFKLIEPGQFDLSWALVTFEAVVEYLKGDPLGLRRGGATTLDAFGFRTGGTASRHGSIGDASMRSLPSRHKLSSGTIAAASQYHTVSMSRQSSDARDRRASMPLGSPDGTWSPTSPMSPSGSSSGAPFPANGLGYFPRTAAPAAGTADPSTQASDPAFDGGASPLLHQDDFKMPGMPASSVSGRPSSRTWHRPGSFYGNVDGSASRDTLADSPRTGPQTQPLSRQSSTRSRTISLNAGSGSELQIRPQIVRSGRRPHGASVSQIDLSQIGPSMERSGSSNGGRSVRVVGSPSLATASPPTASRRKSMDSWTALSIFGGGFGGGVSGSAARSSSSEERGSLDVHSDDRPVVRRVGAARPHSFAESAGSSDGNGFQGNASSSSISWLPWAAEGGSNRRPGTPGTSSIASAEGILDSASIYSGVTRSASGSGFASIHAAVAQQSQSSSAETPSSAGEPGTPSIGASHSRRAPSIRSNSSLSSAPGADDLSAALAEAAATSPHTMAGQLQAAQSTSQLRVPSNRKRYRARFLSNAGSSAPAAPSPATVTREATAGDIHRAGDRRSFGSLSAVMASDAVAAVAASESSSQALGQMLSSSTTPDVEAHASPIVSGHLDPTWTARDDRLIPPFFRLQVPSPVKEISDPLATPSPTIASPTPAGGHSPTLELRGNPALPGAASLPLLLSNNNTNITLEGALGAQTAAGDKENGGGEGPVPTPYHTPAEFDLGIFADISSSASVNAATTTLLDSHSPSPSHSHQAPGLDLSSLLSHSHSTFKRRAARGGPASASS
ncbi:uncharacterized protein PSFLO_04338 [Pseudozyma flocculosa]|uniref:VPS9 domain-containing protein n=1 Tax=Pseudozyma flocculosa TaxID=84751 RepID=A0A5C3F602_9BASI|nr:uncharacterized protein PSFLO_04338 [Pseudozyma flocculosa]